MIWNLSYIPQCEKFLGRVIIAATGNAQVVTLHRHRLQREQHAAQAPDLLSALRLCELDPANSANHDRAAIQPQLSLPFDVKDSPA